MSKSSIRSLALFRRFNKHRLETGFSMLEAVVVVGVLLALAVGGFISYGPIIDNAKKAKVTSAANEIYTAISVASLDGDPLTSPQSVVDTFNSSNDTLKAEIIDRHPALAAMTTTNALSSLDSDFCVQVSEIKKPEISVRVGTCTDVVASPGSDGGSVATVTFTPIPAHAAATPAGIRYVNAVLAYDASVANRTDDWDFKLASAEWIERDAAYSELSLMDVLVYSGDPYYRIDSGLPALNDDYQTKLAAFEADETVAKQQAMVSAHRAVLFTAVANPIPESERVLFPAPSNPEKSQAVTVAAGTGGDVVVRTAIPTSIYKPEWTIGANWLDGVELGGNTVGTDGDYTYWDVTLRSSIYTQLPDGTITGHVWKAGVYHAFLVATDNLGVSHSMMFQITVN